MSAVIDFATRHLRRPRTWLIGVPLVLVLGALAGPYVYINFIQADPPPPLSFADVKPTSSTTIESTTPLVTDPSTTTAPDATTSSTAKARAAAPAATAAALDGPWRLGAGSIAGYRIGETVGITPGEAVGRTEKVTGSMVLNGATVTSGTWTVDMVSVKSDDERRDQNYREDMDVAHYPTSQFVLGAPISLGSIPPDGQVITVQVDGALTLRGRTNNVSFPLQARRNAGRVEAVGSIPVVFADYGIPNPSNGFARTDDHGKVEFLLLFDRE